MQGASALLESWSACWDACAVRKRLGTQTFPSVLAAEDGDYGCGSGEFIIPSFPTCTGEGRSDQWSSKSGCVESGVRRGQVFLRL